MLYKLQKAADMQYLFAPSMMPSCTLAEEIRNVYILNQAVNTLLRKTIPVLPKIKDTILIKMCIHCQCFFSQVAGMRSPVKKEEWWKHLKSGAISQPGESYTFRQDSSLLQYLSLICVCRKAM
jgi:hypothetical protein